MFRRKHAARRAREYVNQFRQSLVLQLVRDDADKRRNDVHESLDLFRQPRSFRFERPQRTWLVFVDRTCRFSFALVLPHDEPENVGNTLLGEREFAIRDAVRGRKRLPHLARHALFVHEAV